MKDFDLKALYDLMDEVMGPQAWWPADSKDEIIMGAILTQNTNWTNVQGSLENLKAATAFQPSALLSLSIADLQALIRPSGFYQNKSRALQSFFTWYQTFDFEPERVLLAHSQNLRQELLQLYGTGPETADVLRLYVFDQVTFVADTYARRLFGQLRGRVYPTYQSLYRDISLEDQFSLAEAQQFHALIDEFGKLYLRPGQDLRGTFLEAVNFYQ